MRIKGFGTVALTLWLVPVMSSVLSGGLAAQTSGPRMPFAGLEKLAAAASETVDVSLDTSLLALAARFMDDTGDEDQAKVKAMLTGLKGVYVRSYEFGADGAFGPTEVEGIRRQMAAPGWSRMAGIRSRKDNANVDVYLWLDGEKIGGLGILATEPRRFTVVNIVGSIDLDQLRRLEGFGLPRLDLERDRDRDKASRDKAKGVKDKRKGAKDEPDGENDDN
ncbi:MAG: DUF4252 domain-containing protein [Vicinamibacteraceae bacterium]